MTNPRRSEAARKGGKASRKRSPWGQAPMVSSPKNHERHRRMYGDQQQ